MLPARQARGAALERPAAEAAGSRPGTERPLLMGVGEESRSGHLLVSILPSDGEAPGTHGAESVPPQLPRPRPHSSEASGHAVPGSPATPSC